MTFGTVPLYAWIEFLITRRHHCFCWEHSKRLISGLRVSCVRLLRDC